MLLKPDMGKQLNRRLILTQIRENEPISRSDIVDATGLSKAAVSSIVGELIEAGLVEETGSQSTAIGRPRILLSLVPQAGMALGAELNGHECRVILTDLRANVVKRVVLPWLAVDASVESGLSLLEQGVMAVTKDVDPDRIVGMGLTVPGVVNPTTGKVLLSIILPWRNVPLMAEAQKRFEFPVAVFTRASAATWGEHWYGSGRNVQNMMYVRIGNGIAGGLVIAGHSYTGQGFGAGEIGHMTVQPDGLLCRCGNRGCLATVATTEVLLNRVRELMRRNPDNPLWGKVDGQPEQLTMRHVAEAADQGNPVAQDALKGIGQWLGVALASVVNLLNLDMIIIGGPIEAAGEALLEPIRQELSRRVLPTHLADVSLVGSTLKEDAPSIGGASLILHELLSPSPLVVPFAGSTDTLTGRFSLFDSILKRVPVSA
ncbi:MAG: ROK family transcriptional regulator [Caldilineaceae bacterium]|nr:ROK family transcriptional regulator [Caldilineaceae bacterium]